MNIRLITRYYNYNCIKNNYFFVNSCLDVLMMYKYMEETLAKVKLRLFLPHFDTSYLLFNVVSLFLLRKSFVLGDCRAVGSTVISSVYPVAVAVIHYSKSQFPK